MKARTALRKRQAQLFAHERGLPLAHPDPRLQLEFRRWAAIYLVDLTVVAARLGLSTPCVRGRWSTFKRSYDLAADWRDPELRPETRQRFIDSLTELVSQRSAV